MSATNANGATDKENLTVRAWALAGESVVKECLTTDSAKKSYRLQQNASSRAMDVDFERMANQLKAEPPAKRVKRTGAGT